MRGIEEEKYGEDEDDEGKYGLGMMLKDKD